MKTNKDIYIEIKNFLNDKKNNPNQVNFNNYSREIEDISCSYELFYKSVKNAYYNKYSFNYKEKNGNTQENKINNIFFRFKNKSISYSHISEEIKIKGIFKYFNKYNIFTHNTTSIQVKLYMKSNHNFFTNLIEQYLERDIAFLFSNKNRILKKSSQTMTLIDNIIVKAKHAGFDWEPVFARDHYYHIDNVIENIELNKDHILLVFDVSIENELTILKQNKKSFIDKLKNLIFK